VENPSHEEIQSDGRIRRWARIAEAGNKALRVVLLEDGETVHNAFFDRSFKEQAMHIKYFPDTDTLLVMFNDNEIVETRDIDESMNIDLDENGKLVSMTIEHAKQRTDVTNFSYQQVAAQ